MKHQLLLLGCALAGTLNAQFVLDEQFANEGILEIQDPLTPSGHIQMMRAADGSIYATGVYIQTSFSYVWHLLEDGTLDPGFGTAGRIFLDSMVVTSLAVQADGKLLCGGLSFTTAVSGAMIARLRTDGTLDPDFADNGIRDLDHPFTSQVREVRALANGEIMAAGNGQDLDGNWITVPWKLTNDGAFDATYLNNNATIARGANDVLFLDDGAMLIAGDTVVKLDVNGYPDPAFNNGLGWFAPDCHCHVQHMASDPQGRALLLIKGGLIFPYLNDQFVYRLSATGEVDPSFGTGGYAMIDDLGTSWSHIDVDPLGRPLTVAIIGLNDDAVISVARYTVDGVPDPSFAPDGVYTSDVPQPEPVNIGIKIAADGADRVKVMFGIRPFTGNNRPFAIMGLVDVASGMAEMEQGPQPSAFPNPAQEVINFTLDGSRITGIVLRNALGRIVLTESTRGSTSVTLAVADLPRGCYHASIVDENGRPAQRSVVLQ